MRLVRFVNLISAGVLTGTVVGIWLGYNPSTFSFSTYLEQHQGAVKGLNTLMPILGLISIVLTLITLFKQKNNRNEFIGLIAAVILLVVAALITRFGNQPINAIIMTWNSHEVPDNWTEVRDKWWFLHKIRAGTTFIAFCFIAWNTVRKE